MRRFGLIGHPLGHSFSKTYFTEKFQREGLDCRYDNFDLDDLSELPYLIKQNPDLKGFNVTAPYKEAILPYLIGWADPVTEIQAVNTVRVLDGGMLLGFNTDVMGLEQTGCFEKPAMTAGTKALVFGTGGVSKAVQYVLRKHQIDYHLVSRTTSQGDYTFDLLTPLIIGEHRLLINATPVGTFPRIDEALPIPYEAITPDHVMLDLIYNPEETRFLQEGKKRGASVLNGLKMLHAQAEASWKIWE